MKIITLAKICHTQAHKHGRNKQLRADLYCKYDCASHFSTRRPFHLSLCYYLVKPGENTHFCSAFHHRVNHKLFTVWTCIWISCPWCRIQDHALPLNTGLLVEYFSTLHVWVCESEESYWRLLWLQCFYSDGWLECVCVCVCVCASSSRNGSDAKSILVHFMFLHAYWRLWIIFFSYRSAARLSLFYCINSPFS